MPARYRSRFAKNGNSKMLKRNPQLKEGGGVDDVVAKAKKAGKRVRKNKYVKKAVEIFDNREAIERKVHNTVAKAK